MDRLMSQKLRLGSGYQLHMIHNVRPICTYPARQGGRADDNLGRPDRFRRAADLRIGNLER